MFGGDDCILGEELRGLFLIGLVLSSVNCGGLDTTLRYRNAEAGGVHMEHVVPLQFWTATRNPMGGFVVSVLRRATSAAGN